MAAVAQMIIDDGVASRAQRRGLLSDRARAVGCALRMHPRHGAVCCVTLAGGYGPPPLKEARKVVADAVNLPDDFEEVLFSVPVVDIHDRVYQALERGGKVVLDYAPGALKLSVWDAAGKGEGSPWTGTRRSGRSSSFEEAAQVIMLSCSTFSLEDATRWDPRCTRRTCGLCPGPWTIGRRPSCPRP